MEAMKMSTLDVAHDGDEQKPSPLDHDQQVREAAVHSASGVLTDVRFVARTPGRVEDIVRLAHYIVTGNLLLGTPDEVNPT